MQKSYLPKISPKEHKEELARKQHVTLSNTFEQVATNWFKI